MYLYASTLFMNKKNIVIYEIKFKIKKHNNFTYEKDKTIIYLYLMNYNFFLIS